MVIEKGFARGLLMVLLLLLPGAGARAGSHTWDVNEVFSNASGTVQFVELIEANGTPGEIGVPGHTFSSNSKSFVLPGAPLTPPTSNKHYLIATPAFVALPGAPTPDAIIPSGSVPFFATGGDTLAYQPWDSFAFGAAQLPTNGTNSLNRNLTTGLNSPTNYAGVTGSVDASAPVPTLSEWGFILFALLLAAVGVRFAIASSPALAGAGGAMLSRRSIAPFGWGVHFRLLAVATGVALVVLGAMVRWGLVEAWIDVVGAWLAIAILTYTAQWIRRVGD